MGFPKDKLLEIGGPCGRCVVAKKAGNWQRSKCLGYLWGDPELRARVPDSRSFEPPNVIAVGCDEIVNRTDCCDLPVHFFRRLYRRIDPNRSVGESCDDSARRKQHANEANRWTAG